MISDNIPNVDPLSKVENVLMVCIRLRSFMVSLQQDRYEHPQFPGIVELVDTVHNGVVEEYYKLFKIRDALKTDNDLFNQESFGGFIQTLIRDQPDIRRGIKMGLRASFPVTENPFIGEEEGEESDPAISKAALEEMRQYRVAQTLVAMNRAADDLGLALDLILK